jgi:phosphatidylserine decarboxylase
MDLNRITYWNRHTAREEEEQVYGGAWLEWIYGSALGKAALHTLVKRSAFSALYGALMDAPGSAKRILPFIEEYGLNAGDFLDAPESFRSFNEFFFRKLRPEVRPVDGRSEVAVLPADGRHLGFADASAAEGVYVKGQRFDLGALLGGETSERYRGGALVCSRLCPVDYHRFHFPVAGVPGEAVRTGGFLYSVNPIALRLNLGYLWENVRWLVEVESGDFGRVAMLAVGATNVGSVVETYRCGERMEKGSERGYFRFGGSYMMTFFEPGRVRLEDDLLEAGRTGRELYARYGTPLGRRLSRGG